jgi:hypothetical protein
MGVFQKALLKGTKNKCANLYVEEVVRRFRSAVRSNFPHSPKTLFNIHNELASNLFSELDIFLRIKNNYSIAEIDAHFFSSNSSVKRINSLIEFTSKVVLLHASE